MACHSLLVLALLVPAILGCHRATDESQPEDETPAARSYPPDHTIPCFHAMRALPFAPGENLRAVSDAPEGCAITIWFDTEDDIQAFRRDRVAAGKSPGSMLQRLEDGSEVEITLRLEVGDTVPH